MPPIQISGQDVSLLILPQLPSPLTRPSLWTAYKSTFEQVLRKVAPAASSTAVSRLDIAITLPTNWSNKSRTARYPEDQFTFQETYTLVCLAAARTKTDLDFPGGVDVRIFLLAPHAGSYETTSAWLSGPMVDLPTLVASDRSYKTLYGVEGEEGEAALQAFLSESRNQRQESPTVCRLPCGPSMSANNKYARASSGAQSISQSSGIEDKPVEIHHNVAVGGTFDHLHSGHKLLLTMTVYISDPVSTDPSNEIDRTIIIGMTGDELLVNKKYPEYVESWETRQQRTHDFVDSIFCFSPRSSSSSTSSTTSHRLPSLSKTTEYIDNPGPNGKTVKVMYSTSTPSSSASPHDESNTHTNKNPPQEKVTINYTRISDPFGPTITIQNLSALTISAETRAGGKAVNDKRREKSWRELEIFEVGVLDADVVGDEDGDNNNEEKEKEKEGFDGKISSTELRRRMAEFEKGPSVIHQGEGEGEAKMDESKSKI